MPGRHGGDFAKIVDGVNQTLDAIVDPLNVALAYIEKAANGEELEDLENNYKGQYGILIGNLQQVKTSLYTLLEESGKLTEASKKGDLSYRADIGRLKGRICADRRRYQQNDGCGHRADKGCHRR